MADQRVNEADEPHADAAALHDEPSQDEEGNGKKNVVPGARDHGLRQHDELRRAARPEIGRGGQEQHEADRHASEYRCEKEGERGDDRGIVAQSQQPRSIRRRRQRRRDQEKRGDEQRQPPMRPP